MKYIKDLPPLPTNIEMEIRKKERGEDKEIWTFTGYIEYWFDRVHEYLSYIGGNIYDVVYIAYLEHKYAAVLSIILYPIVNAD